MEYCENPEESIPMAVSVCLELSGMSIYDDPAPVDMLEADESAEMSELPAEVAAAVMLLLLSVTVDVNERFMADVILGMILELVKSVIEPSVTALLPTL